jgi:hypothetical protein
MPATAPWPPTTLITASHTPTALVPPFHEGDWVGPDPARGIAPDDQQSAAGAKSPAGPSAETRCAGEASVAVGLQRLLRARGRGPDWGGETRGIRRGDGRDHGPKSAIRLSAKGVSMDRRAPSWLDRYRRLPRLLALSGRGLLRRNAEFQLRGARSCRLEHTRTNRGQNQLRC